MHISGRTFPVQIKYLSQPEPNYVEGCLQTVWDINKEEPPGDILVFLTGQEEIESLQLLLQERITLLPKTAKSLLVILYYIPSFIDLSIICCVTT